MNGTSLCSEDLIEIIRSKTICQIKGSQTLISSLVTKNRVIKGEEGGVAVGGVVAQWHPFHHISNLANKG